MESKKEEIEIQLFSSTDEFEINQVCAILEENNIPYVRNDYGSGSYMNLYMGQSIQEKTVSVHKDNYNKSLELISYLFPNNACEEPPPELVEESDNNEDDSSQNKYTSVRRSFGFLIVAIISIPILVMIISTLLFN